MENTTETNLKTLVELVQKNELLLPDFQRGFVWDVETQKRLVASVLAKMPLGSILVLEANKNDYGYRLIGRKDSPKLSGNSETYALLDGQQRLTVLANVFSNLLYLDYENPGKMIDDYKKLSSIELKYRFFLRIPSIDILEEENDWFGLKKLCFPITNVENKEERLDFLTRDILGDIIAIPFDEKTEECYVPNTKKSKDIWKYAIQTDQYLIPLYLLISDKNQLWSGERLDKVLQEIVDEVIDYRLEKEYAVLNSEEERLDYVEKILPPDFLEDVISDGKVNIDTLKQQWKLMAKVCWSDRMKAYLNSCITALDLHQIVVKKSDRDRAIDIYENLNIGGISLSTFELVMARAAKEKLPQNKNLFETIVDYIQTEREYETCLIPECMEKYAISKNYSASNEMECYNEKKNELNKKYTEGVLDVLSLLSYAPDYTSGSVETSQIKQKKILNLDEKQILHNWKKACEGIDRACYFLKVQCGVRKIQEVSYNLMLVLLGYIYANDSFYKDKKVTKLLVAWYWSAIFAGRYDKDQTPHVVEDINNILKTIADGDDTWLLEMKNNILDMKGFSDGPTLLLQTSVTPKGALRKSICQFYLAGTYKDLMTDTILHSFLDETKKLEEHHLVPLGTFSRDYKTMEKDERSNKRSIFNSPLNFAYITKDSNKAIGNTSIDQYVKIVDQDSVLELHLDSLQSGQQLLNKENLEKALANRLIHIKKDINKRIQNNM